MGRARAAAAPGRAVSSDGPPTHSLSLKPGPRSDIRDIPSTLRAGTRSCLPRAATLLSGGTGQSRVCQNWGAGGPSLRPQQGGDRDRRGCPFPATTCSDLDWNL